MRDVTRNTGGVLDGLGFRPSHAYAIRLDFDCEGKSPAVFITKNGSKVLEVFDEPTCDGEWTRDESQWTVGAFTRQLLVLMNEYA